MLCVCVCVCVCLPSCLYFLAIFDTTELWVGFPVLYSLSSLVTYFIHSISSVYMSIPISQSVPLSLSFFVSINVLSVQFCSIAQSCPTLCDPMDHSPTGLPVHHRLPESTQTHVHWVSVAIQPSHPLSSPSPPAFYPCHYFCFANKFVPFFLDSTCKC